MKSIVARTKQSIIEKYGFVADYRLSTSHNVSIELGRMPSWLYFSRPTNIAFHNLCIHTPIPPNYKALLGLGLNFCIQPRYTQGPKDLEPFLERFRRDIYTQLMFAGSSTLPATKLFIRSNWTPPSSEIPIEFRSRVSSFLTNLQKEFCSKTVLHNLTVSQNVTLQSIRSRVDFVVWKTDKNLGPAIIERSEYIRRALIDHLNDTSTYRRLTPEAAHGRINSIRIIIGNFIKTYFSKPTDGSPFDPLLRSYGIFLRRSIDETHISKPFGMFYLLAKVHKNPWSTRPIVSCSGSILHGLGAWVDQELQKIIRHLPYTLKSSADMVSTLKTLPLLSANARLFSCDATSMYTNIDTGHALDRITSFLKQNTLTYAVDIINIDALITGLRIVMTHNVFCFGDTYWVQLTGTAMGTPPAPMYATLYFAIHEIDLLVNYTYPISYYCRYIDDGFGIWIPDPNPFIDATLWQRFQQQFNDYGKLRWVFSDRVSSLDYLDLNISISTTGSIATRLFEKALNLYLYLPPHSAHPPGVLKGLIYGMILRIRRLTFPLENVNENVLRFYRRLRARGYSSIILKPIFYAALTNVSTPIAEMSPLPSTPAIKLHLQFHPRDPSSEMIQRCARCFLLNPLHEPRLSELRNHNNNVFPADRLLVVYHRPRTLGNLLSPRQLNPSGIAVSAIIGDDTSNTAHQLP